MTFGRQRHLTRSATAALDAGKQITDRLTVSNRQSGGYPDELRSGFALHLVHFVIHYTVAPLGCMFCQLPVEPEVGEDGVITIALRTPDSQTHKRRFRVSDFVKVSSSARHLRATEKHPHLYFTF